MKEDREHELKARILLVTETTNNHQLGKLWPVGRGAGDLLAEHLFASGRLELAHLSGFVLGGGRDARIAVNHAFIVHQESASKKANFINGAAMMQIS
jgi:hypothetical protein